MQLTDLATRLNAISESQTIPSFDWPTQLSPQAWCWSPSLISIADESAWATLDEASQRHIARNEAVNFFSLNIHGERLLRDGIASRPRTGAIGTYLDHFSREEDEHSAIFRSYCERYSDGPWPMLALTDLRADDDLLFFLRVLIFERLVDAFNRRIMHDPLVHPLVRSIHAYHHREESRHMAFGEALIDEHLRREQLRRRHDGSELCQILESWIDWSWHALFNPRAWPMLDQPLQIRARAIANPAVHSRRQELTGSITALLERVRRSLT